MKDLNANEKMLYDLAWEPISYCYVTDTPTLLPTITPSGNPTTGRPSSMPTDEVSTLFEHSYVFLVISKKDNIDSTLLFHLSSQYSHQNDLHLIQQHSPPSILHLNQQTYHQ